MAGYLFGERQVQVIGETFQSLKRGPEARGRIRALCVHVESNPHVIRDAAHLGCTFLGYERFSATELIAISRKRFRAAGLNTDILGNIGLEAFEGSSRQPIESTRKLM